MEAKQRMQDFLSGTDLGRLRIAVNGNVFPLRPDQLEMIEGCLEGEGVYDSEWMIGVFPSLRTHTKKEVLNDTKKEVLTAIFSLARRTE